MTQQESEKKIAYYLYEKGAKPNSSIFINTQKVSDDVKISLKEVQEIFQNSRYFEFSNGTSVGLILKKEGLDFVEGKNKRIIDSVLKWVAFFLGLIASLVAVINFL